MTGQTRDSLKKLFKKVKNLRLDPLLLEVNFENNIYYSWLNQSEMCLYIVYDFKKVTTGIRLETVRPPTGALRLGFCEFCQKHRKQAEVLFVSAETKKRPKGVNYQSRGTWICADFLQCNKDLKNSDLITDFFERILEKP